MGNGLYASHPGQKASHTNLPLHIAIIMDGNGRWATSRGLSRTNGHKSGVKAAKEIISVAQEKGVKVLTLFAFGVENWKRPSKEVRNIFRLFFLVLRKEISRLHAESIRLRIIGDRQQFSPQLTDAIEQAEALTQENTGLVLNIAVNYSGRWDLLQAIQALGEKKHIVDEASLSQAMALGDLPEPDLFIRTGGVKRISNFILWELAYTELYFSERLWPDFTREAFDDALEDYAKRERRFGLTAEQVEQHAN